MPVDVTGVVHTLLVLLARAAGDEVSTASIIAGIWGREAPEDAENTVASHVARLRKALTAAAPNVDPTRVVLTLPSGYILDVPATNVDVARFERLVEDGRRALRFGQPELAVTRFDDALALWRGAAYADTRDQPFVRPEAVRLDELKLAAWELKIEAVLAVAAPCAPESLVAEIDTLLAQNWHRERLWILLMTALFRRGHRTEALAAHRQAQTRLAEGILLDTGPALKAAERAVVTGDRSLLGSPLRGTQVPAAIAATEPACVGRAEEIEWLEAALDLAVTRRSQARLIVGSAGIGKTRLVSALGQRAADRGAVVRYCRAGASELPCLTAELDRATVILVDDLDRGAPDHVSRVTEFIRSTRNLPVLTLLTCRDTARVGQLVGLPKLFLSALDHDAVAEIVRVYAPSTADAIAVGAMINTNGVPARLHRAASEWAFVRAGRRIDRAAQAAAERGGRTASLRNEIVAGILDLEYVRARARELRAPAEAVPTPYKGLASYHAADTELFHGRELLTADVIARLVEAPLLAIVGATGTGKSSLIRAGLLPALASGVLLDSASWRQIVVTPTSVESLADFLRDDAITDDEAVPVAPIGLGAGAAVEDHILGGARSEGSASADPLAEAAHPVAPVAPDQDLSDYGQATARVTVEDVATEPSNPSNTAQHGSTSWDGGIAESADSPGHQPAVPAAGGGVSGERSEVAEFSDSVGVDDDGWLRGVEGPDATVGPSSVGSVPAVSVPAASVQVAVESLATAPIAVAPTAAALTAADPTAVDPAMVNSVVGDSVTADSVAVDLVVGLADRDSSGGDLGDGDVAGPKAGGAAAGGGAANTGATSIVAANAGVTNAGTAHVGAANSDAVIDSTAGADAVSGAVEGDDLGSWRERAVVIDDPVLLVVDQFEEVFTTLDDQQRHAFLDTLVAATATTRVVVSLRSEFYGRCVEHPELARLVTANTLLLPVMSDKELRRAIEWPAAQAGVSIEEELVAALVRDSAWPSGELSQLSTVLHSLWLAQSLTLDAYTASGGVAAAVESFAERAYAALGSEAERGAARRILVELVREVDGVLVRQRRESSDLVATAGRAGSAALAILTEQGLLDVDGELVQVVHEVVLDRWPRLREWLDDTTIDREVRQHLTRAATAWRVSGSRHGLYSGVRLATVAELAAERPRELSMVEHDFLTASRELLLAAETKRRQRVMRLRQWLAATVVALVGAVAMGAVALVKLAEADSASQRRDAARLAAQAQAEPDLRLGLLLAVAATTLDSAAGESVRTTLLRSPDLLAAAGSAVSAMAVSPDGRTIAMGSADGSLSLLSADNLGGMRQLQASGPGPVQGLEFTADGRRLVSWSVAPDAGIMVWDVASGSAPGPAFGQVSAGSTGGLLADGVTLVLAEPATAAAPATTVAWSLDARTPSTVYDLPSTAAAGLTLAPDGRRVGWGTPTGVLVIDPVTGASRAVDGARRPSALSAGGELLSVDGLTVTVWDGAGRRYGEVRHLSGDVLQTAWAPDGKSFASAGDDGTVMVWDMRTLQPINRLTAGDRPVRQLRFATDGRTLFAVETDGALLAWDPAGTRGIGATVSGSPDTASLVRLACFVAGRDMTPAEWRHHVPDHDYSPVCPQ